MLDHSKAIAFFGKNSIVRTIGDTSDNYRIESVGKRWFNHDLFLLQLQTTKIKAKLENEKVFSDTRLILPWVQKNGDVKPPKWTTELTFSTILIVAQSQSFEQKK